MTIRKAEKADASLLGALAAQLWPHSGAEKLAEGFRALLQASEAACFLQYQKEQPVGFAQCQLRHDYVEGTSTSPVGYLEGIYIKPEARQQGAAKALLRACEQWARAQGCTEFASDCEPENTVSIAFHQAVGFTEENRIVCFRKDLVP